MPFWGIHAGDRLIVYFCLQIYSLDPLSGIQSTAYSGHLPILLVQDSETCGESMSSTLSLLHDRIDSLGLGSQNQEASERYHIFARFSR